MSAPHSPSGEPGAHDAPPWTLIGVAAGLLLIRLLVGRSLHLTEDEAYYRLWAQAPSLGYYDHPPMIAWWIWLGVRAAGDNPLGVRLAPILASAVTSALVFDLARLAGGSRAAAQRAGIWYNATLLAAAGGFLAVPDSPAALFWAFCLWAAFRALGSGALAWWLAAGAAAGLASLSKYSALFLGPGMLLWLISTTRGRASLRTPGPWLALVVAAALFALNVGWNAAHQWLTFAKQFGRIAPHRLAPRYLLEFLATEVLLLNPLLAVFLARLGRDGAEGSAPARAWPFLATSAPFVGYLLLHSLHDRIQAHWPAPVYPALAICAAFAAERARGGWRVARTAVPWFGFGVCAAAALYLSLPVAGVPLRFDPALPVRGWSAFAVNIEDLRQGAGAGWVGTTSYGLAAELAAEPTIDAPILQISERERWRGLRRGAWADAARPGLIIDLPRRMDVGILRRCFARVQPLGALDRGPPGETRKRYAAVLVAGPRRDLVRDGCGGG
ncbi:MAG TPA: glycosyltransferase family 39 protein [Caulobacteraceae bacterium]|nr:glycosyltransferase family 39 protein [Caulobacteraceae bacterium]